MDLSLLEVFLRVCEMGSINKAATHLGISQSTLSRHIAALEHEFRCTAFVRTQGGVVLTDAGRLLADRARPLLRQFMMMKEQITDQAAGQLALGTPPAWQNLFTSPFVETLAKEQPRIVLRIHEGLSNVLRDYMFAGLLDIAIIPFGMHSLMGYKKTSILREPILLVGGVGAGLSPQEPIDIEFLGDREMVLPAAPNVLRVRLERAMQRKGVGFQLRAETDSLELNLALAKRGVGLTAVPASSLHDSVHAGQLTWAPIKGQHVAWSLCENISRGHSQAVNEGRKIVFKVLSDALDVGAWEGAEPMHEEIGPLDGGSC